MIVSRCCKAGIFVVTTNEGTAFYVCDKCQRACDTIMLLNLNIKENIDAEI